MLSRAAVRRALPRIAVAALTTVCAALLRQLLDPLLGRDFPYILFFASISAAAWFGGLSGGLWAVAFGGFVSVWLFIPPVHTIKMVGVRDSIGLMLFAVVGIIISMCVQFAFRARARAMNEPLLRKEEERNRQQAERDRTEALIRTNEANLADFFENASFGFHSVDERGTILRCNLEELTITGYRADEYVGHNIAEFHVEPLVVSGILDCLRRGEFVRDCRSQLRCKDGTVKDVMISSTPRMGDDHRFLHSRCFTLDISDRVLAERAEAQRRESDMRFEMIADNLSVMAWSVDPAGKPTWYNRRWYEFSGMSLDEINTDGWRRMHHPDHLERVIASVRASREHGVEWEDTFPLRGADGEYRWFLSRLVPIRDDQGSIVRWFGTSVDITGRMAMEAELRAADKRKDEFVATLAHELRNPLAPLQHALQVIEWRVGADKDVGRMVAIMQRQVAQMSQLVDDLIELSRMSQGRMTLRKTHVDVAVLVANAVEAVRPLAERAEVNIQVALPEFGTPIDADELRITQVLTNLLGNACKFSRPGGIACIEATMLGDRLRLVVSDNGIGIAADRLPHVFDMFNQGHERSEYSRGGLGIGLTLVQGIVAMHGGTVEAHSDGIDRGCSFVVSLPVGIATIAPHVPTSSPSAHGGVEVRTPGRASAARVLVADDNPDGVETLSTLLRMGGYNVTAMLSGKSALAAFMAAPFDIVILDIGMPELSGYDVCQQLRALPNGRAALVIALTGWGQAKDRQRSQDAGFDAHFVKPVDHEQLIRMLNEHQAMRA